MIIYQNDEIIIKRFLDGFETPVPVLIHKKCAVGGWWSPDRLRIEGSCSTTGNCINCHKEFSDFAKGLYKLILYSQQSGYLKHVQF